MIVYTSEAGKQYTSKDILMIAKGNDKIAKALLSVAQWQHIETIFHENIGDEWTEDGRLCLYDKVQVTSLTDDTADKNLLNRKGEIIGFNYNEMTGNTRKDPMVKVKFSSTVFGDFWSEELTVIK